MKDISTSNFGLLIAYALPGFVAVWALNGLWPGFAGCTADNASCTGVLSLVGFLNSTIAALAAGMAVSAVRFAIIDTLHGLTGVRRPRWDGPAFQSNLAAVETVVEQHYRYYQFHANMLVAGVFAFGVHLYRTESLGGLPDLLLVLLALVFWITARDNLKKYYTALDTLFDPNPKAGHPMSNGMSDKPHDPKAATDKKGNPKPTAPARNDKDKSPAEKPKANHR